MATKTPPPKVTQRKGAPKGHAPYPGAGRPKGSVGKKTVYKQALERVKAEVKSKGGNPENKKELGPVYGKTPLEFMLAVMADRKMPTGFRAAAAKDAAPYVHPKLATVTVQGNPNQPVATHNMDTAEFKAIAKKMAKDI